MPTTYTSLLGLALPTTGELTGTWGTTVNDYITQYLDASVAGTQTLSTDANVTLTVTNGSNLGATSAQYAILNCTGARTVQRTITVPAASKSYLVINGTTGGQSVSVVGAGPTTGVTLVNGERALIAWNGSDFVKVGSTVALPAGSNTQVQYNNAGALAGSANLTFNGTTLTANALTVSTGNAGVGTSLPPSKLTVSNNATALTSPAATVALLVGGADGAAAATANLAFGNTAVSMLQRANGTNAAPTTLSAFDIIGQIQARGYNGTAYTTPRCNISFLAAENWTATANGAYLSFVVTPAGSATTAEVAIISDTGRLEVGRGTISGPALNTSASAARVRVAGSAAYDDRTTAASGTVSHGAFTALGPDSVSATNTGVTYTNASMLYIAGPPSAGTNVTITNPYALFIAAGTSYFAGNVGIGATSPVSKLSVLGPSGVTSFTGSTRLGVSVDGAVSTNDYSGVDFILNGSVPRARIAAYFSGSGSYLQFGTSNNYSTGITNTALTLDFNGGITSANLADAVGYKGTPLNEQSTAYTLVIGDQGKSIVHPITDNNARTFTIPANGTVPFPVGTTITFINMINTVTIAITTDTMYLAGAGTTGSRTLAAYGMATAVKVTSTSWIISGNGLT
jgi:hypothetical protein